jgi:pyruvate/2-oxoglutarate/acetoin dehydrogenase E1 component
MKRVLHALNESLHNMMQTDPKVLVIGEDIIDPYGGAFKVTKGLSGKHPDRVITTPISEAGIVGLGIGLALRGFKPIVEIMFGDFITLISDQMINQASKISWMYNEDIDFNLVVRTPMGGRRGYGPTHSQTLEKLYMGVPGLIVASISHVCDPGLILRRALFESRLPVLLIENKLLYSKKIVSASELEEDEGLLGSMDDACFPTVTLSHSSQPDVTLIVYGGMLPMTVEAARLLHREEELDIEIVVPHQLSPLEIGPLADSVQRTRRVVVIEEGVMNYGWGAEVIAQLSSIQLEAPPERVGAASTPIPAGRRMEDEVLPQVNDIVDAAIRTVDMGFR